MPIQMLQIAAYALVIAFFLLFGLFLFLLIQPYTREEQAPPLSPAQQARMEALWHELRIGDYALALGLFLLVGLLTFLLAKKDERQQKHGSHLSPDSRNRKGKE